jgi:hypothetical protein
MCRDGVTKVYVDESGTDAGSPVMCVAGYLFRPHQDIEFQAEWHELLTKYGLPFFHMSACAPDPGMWPFDHLSKSERINAASEAIQIIKRRSEIGWSVAVREGDFNMVIKNVAPRSTAYSFCLSMIMDGVMRWADANNFDDRIDYFFERGHKDAAVSHELMTEVFKDDWARERYRYRRHLFSPKKDSFGCQAADLLAWQFFKYEKDHRLTGSRRPRADFVELVRPQDLKCEMSALMLATMFNRKYPLGPLEMTFINVLAFIASKRLS